MIQSWFSNDLDFFFSRVYATLKYSEILRFRLILHALHVESLRSFCIQHALANNTIVVYENISIFMTESYISLFDLIDFDRFDTFVKLNMRIWQQLSYVWIRYHIITCQWTKMWNSCLYAFTNSFQPTIFHEKLITRGSFMQCASILEHFYFWIYSLRYVDFLLFHSFFFFLLFLILI